MTVSMTVKAKPSKLFEAATPVALFTPPIPNTEAGQNLIPHAVEPHGNRFLINTVPLGASETALTVVQTGSKRRRMSPRSSTQWGIHIAGTFFPATLSTE
ncbi:MAG: hypothetical protein IT165_28640 [Bryobacterales bacterium]|nr:hypothetical protein [Bryobacterales bacterium]